MKNRRYGLIRLGTLVSLLCGVANDALAEELVARVEMRDGTPRLVVNGEVTPARMFWGRSNGKRIPLGSAWSHFEWKLTPHAPIEKGVFAFRTCEGQGRLVVSNLTVTAEGEQTQRRSPFKLAAEKTYAVSFDIRGEDATWFRCGLEQQEDGVYKYHAQEVPWDDGELTSLVSESRQALASGCKFVTFFTANCWRDGQDDWGPYDAQFRQLMAIDPKVRLIPRVTVNAPAWWLKKHPECAMVYEGGVTGTYASVSSRLYRQEANAYLGRLVRHLMKTYPANFAGIHFSGQNSAEWFYNRSDRFFFGYDVGTRDAFRRYLAKQGDPDAARAEVPTPEERHLCKDAPERLIDVKKRRRILDFQRFLQIEMADTVGELAQTCRVASEGKKIVLAFYGYHWELAGYPTTPGNTGHYGLMYLLNTWGSNLDALSGPVSYSGRAPIGYAGVMSAAETILRHGILWFDEDDLRVHALDMPKSQAWVVPSQSLEGDRLMITRTVGMEAARGLGGWWMDLFGSGWYSDEGTWAIIKQLHAFEQRTKNRPIRVPEVALFSDEESMLHLERMRSKNVPAVGCMNFGRTALAKAGVSFGQYVLEDALAKPLDAKVEIHSSTWCPRDVDALVRQVRERPDVTRVWCWAPPVEATGFALRCIKGTLAKVKATTTGRAMGLDAEWSIHSEWPEQIDRPLAPLYAATDATPDETWATWPDGSAAIAVRKNAGGSGYSVFCGIPCLTAKLLAAACRLGGVHQYLPPDRVGKGVVWAGNGFLTVQSYEDATFTVDTGFRGDVRDALTGELLAKGSKVKLHFNKGDVRILEETPSESDDYAVRNIFTDGEFFIGCNYWAKHAGMYMWSQWRPDIVEAELAALARYGTRVMRVFPLWSDFQPLTGDCQCRGGYRSFRFRDNQPLPNPDGVDPVMMQRFRTFCDIAQKHDIKLIVGLVTGWMSGRHFVPSVFEEQDVIASPIAVYWQTRFVRHFVRALKDHPAIAAWDYGNECNALGGNSQAVFCNWMEHLAMAIRAIDAKRPIVSGMHGLSTFERSANAIRPNGEVSDILCTHPYQFYVPGCGKEAFNTMRTELHPTAESLLYRDLGGKPCFLEEIGNLGRSCVSDARTAAGMRCTLFSAWAHDLKGCLWWCNSDQEGLDFPPYSLTPCERELGMLSQDLSPRPVMLEMKAFEDFRATLPFTKLPKAAYDCVVVVPEKEPGWEAGFGAYLLARQAGLTPSFAGAEAELPEAPLYIVTSVRTDGGYSYPAQKRIYEKAKNGATVLVLYSGSMRFTLLHEHAGVTVDYCTRSPCTRTFALDSASQRPMQVQDATTCRLLQGDADVLARTTEGDVALTCFTCGKGKVLLCNAPIDRQAIDRIDVLSGTSIQPYYLVVREAASRARLRHTVTKGDCPFVAITEHPTRTGKVYAMAINFEPREQTCPIALDGKLGRVFRGNVTPTQITLPPNEVALFEVEPAP